FRKHMAEKGVFLGFRELPQPYVSSSYQTLSPEAQTPEIRGRDLENPQSRRSIPSVEPTKIEEEIETLAQLEQRPTRRKRDRWRKSKEHEDEESEIESRELSVHTGPSKRSEVLDFDDFDDVDIDDVDGEFGSSRRRSRKGQKNHNNKLDLEEMYRRDPTP